MQLAITVVAYVEVPDGTTIEVDTIELPNGKEYLPIIVFENSAEDSTEVLVSETQMKEAGIEGINYDFEQCSTVVI